MAAMAGESLVAEDFTVACPRCLGQLNGDPNAAVTPDSGLLAWGARIVPRPLRRIGLHFAWQSTEDQLLKLNLRARVVDVDAG